MASRINPMKVTLPHIPAKARKLKGQTLIEVLTSLSILSTVFVMGLMLFQQFTGIQAPVERQQTRLMVADWLSESPAFAPENEERENRGRLLVRRVRLIDPARQTYWVEVSAFWGERLLERRWKVMHGRE